MKKLLIMSLQDNIAYRNIKLQTIAENSRNRVDLLRLDLLHPVISGNKWFKLKIHLQKATENNSQGLLSFGGPYSNHIVATAYAAASLGLKSVGIIRGETGKIPSPTLTEARELGMKIYHVSREDYKHKQETPVIQQIINQHPNFHIIPEGAADEMGMLGAAEIASTVPDFPSYNYICCAIGTGTMMAGLVHAASPTQELIGFSGFKNHFELQKLVLSLLPEEDHQKRFSFNHDYAFGGYGKVTPALIDFMNKFYRDTGTPTDRVYSGKLLAGVMELFNKSFFPAGTSVLAIHCGGLQGNRSFPPGTLCF